MIVLSLRHVRSGQSIPILEYSGRGEESISLKDATGKAIREVAEKLELDPMKVMADPNYNRFLLVLTSDA